MDEDSYHDFPAQHRGQTEPFCRFSTYEFIAPGSSLPSSRLPTPSHDVLSITLFVFFDTTLFRRRPIVDCLMTYIGMHGLALAYDSVCRRGFVLGRC